MLWGAQKDEKPEAAAPGGGGEKSMNNAAKALKSGPTFTLQPWASHMPLLDLPFCTYEIRRLD